MSLLIGWIIPNYLFSVGLLYVSVSASLAITSFNTAIVFILSVLWLGDKFSWYKAVGVVLTIMGVVTISFNNQFTGSYIGVLIMLTIAVIIAVYNVRVKE